MTVAATNTESKTSIVATSVLRSTTPAVRFFLGAIKIVASSKF
ncbi:hypothetical protein [Aureimonas altamirensis]|nr:hypothetical protein [Aureimonas altamirensis]